MNESTGECHCSSDGGRTSDLLFNFEYEYAYDDSHPDRLS